MINIIDKIADEKNITKDELEALLSSKDLESIDYLKKKARSVCDLDYGNKIFTRGLIEFTNYCKNDCYYCGIRKSNSNVNRYRLSIKEIMECCENGYELGFRTFVLQGGEDGYYTDEILCDLIHNIHLSFPDCAITLSVGEKSKDTYYKYFEAGAERYLLRHETGCENHYKKLHPLSMNFNNRIRCLKDLKDIGFQTGCGFMVGTPEQTVSTLLKDLELIKEINPHMVGIGPFIPASNTPFEKCLGGKLEETLRILAIIRLIHPKVLLPATTALGTINPKGRELGILSGANVVMPNLSPTSVRKKYALYDNKICTGDEAAECKNCLELRMKSIGYEIVISRGDSRV